jgi:multiple sugar transport system ATP-binding protein
MSEIGLEHLTKIYPTGVTALRDVSLTVRDGELLALMGPSGCGKTTLLRVIAGLEQPTAGNIRIDGQVANCLPPYRRDLAMVFQKPALYPHLNVRQNLGFGVRIHSDSAGHYSQRLEEVARLLQLEELLERFPYHLSGGQQQRVALARAILRRPQAFLLDEPLSNLDARLRIEMRRELHLLHRHLRATMIYVTHDQAEALTLGDRVAVLDAGVVQQLDTPGMLLKRPANRTVAASLGVPGMNLMDGEIAGERSSLCFTGCGVRLAIPGELAELWSAFRGRPLTLGVRPENVRLSGVDRQLGSGRENGPARLTMKAVLIEPQGDDSLLVLQRDEWNITVRLDHREMPSLLFREGETIEVVVEMEMAHLFDRASGLALCHPESG